MRFLIIIELKTIEFKNYALFSKQSSEVDKNYDLEKEFELFKNNFKDKVVKRPNNWGGYIVIPNKN